MTAMRQGTLTAFARSTSPMPASSTRYQHLTRKLEEMCAIDMRPISIVNGQGFKEFIHSLDPSYQVPSHTTVRAYVKKAYTDAKAALIDILTNQQSVALTTDIWTSHSTESYLTHTCHFIIVTFDMRSPVLATRKLTERHTGVNIASEISDLINEFRLPKI